MLLKNNKLMFLKIFLIFIALAEKSAGLLIKEPWGHDPCGLFGGIPC